MNKSIGLISRMALVACGLALTGVLFVPLWQIDLVAPQYPEGLSLLIYPNKLAGDVDIINGLNHYIGMKTLHSGDFPEFSILPYLIGFFALVFLSVAVSGRRRWLYAAFGLFLLFGIVAMTDFWRWEYNYGHDLNPDAAIKVPGMSYEPPLIGYKQLLNFSAYSIPAAGGWLFVGVGVVSLLCVISTWRSAGRNSEKTVAFTLFSVLLYSSCTTGPTPIKTGKDVCTFCKMTLTDVRFGAEIMTKKGKAYKFDDSHCLLSYLHNSIESKEVADIYFVSFDGPHTLVDVNQVVLFSSEDLKSPMGGNVAAFSNRDSMQRVAQQYAGSPVSWTQMSGQ